MVDIPVKTNFLNAIKTAIEGITIIKKVIRNPSIPYDRETEPFPVCFIFDEEEVNADRNRLQMKTFPLHIEIWIQSESGRGEIGDEADLMQAEVNKVLIDNKSILAYGMNLKENSAVKFYADEILGGIILRYEAIYSHARGNAYNPMKG